MARYQDDCTIVVSSCDKYRTAWYPYFELIKTYWQDRPENICLITETEEYKDSELNINCVVCGTKMTWSERLYKCLSEIKTKYIIFLLEDFFLLDYVKNEQIQECFEWMEADESIACCRFRPSDHPSLKNGIKHGLFSEAGDDTPYRLDTQAGLWNRETLMSFIDLSETPWEFESKGTKRIIGTDKKFYWMYQEDEHNIENMLYPYRIFQKYGYGIAWGKWLWKNPEWFVQNGIENVNYSELGILSEEDVLKRFEKVFDNSSKSKISKLFIKANIYFDRLIRSIKINGFKRTLDEYVGKIKRRLK